MFRLELLVCLAHARRRMRASCGGRMRSKRTFPAGESSPSRGGGVTQARAHPARHARRSRVQLAPTGRGDPRAGRADRAGLVGRCCSGPEGLEPAGVLLKRSRSCCSGSNRSVHHHLPLKQKNQSYLSRSNRLAFGQLELRWVWQAHRLAGDLAARAFLFGQPIDLYLPCVVLELQPGFLWRRFSGVSAGCHSDMRT